MSRTVCIWIPQFELRQRIIDLDCRSVSDETQIILLRDKTTPPLVKDACAAAKCIGIEPHMTIDQARALCPEALFIYSDSNRFHDLQKRILIALYDFSPNLGSDNNEAFFLSLNGLERLHSNLENLCLQLHDTISSLGFPAAVAIADNPLTAYIAAHHLMRHSSFLRIPFCVHPFSSKRSASQSTKHLFTIIPPRGDLAFLKKLPLDALPLSSSLNEFLDLLGLLRIADVGRLPSGSLMRRFGRIGALFEASLRGTMTDFINPFLPEHAYEETISLDNPTNDLGMIVCLSEPLLDRLLLRVSQANLCIAALQISLFPTNSNKSAIVRRMNPAKPTLQRRVFLDLLHSWLSTASIEEYLSSILIRTLDLQHKPQRQLSLFKGHLAAQAAAFSLARSRLEAAHGKSSLLRPLLNECYFPEHRLSWIPYAATDDVQSINDYKGEALVPIFDLIDPPRSITLIHSWIYFYHAPRPRYRSCLSSSTFVGARKKIVHRRGPFHLDHKWWKTELSARQYEILLLEDMSHILIFHDRDGSFLQAYLD